jgi:hypothetical protein
MKLVFDSSIHLGQFCITDEQTRILAKNSQIMISDKPDNAVTGIESFNEVAYADHIIWSLDREPQDIFYKFMDTFHSEKNILRVPLSQEETRLMNDIASQYNIHPSNALTCALAITQKASTIHSLYSDFQRADVIALLESYNIKTNSNIAQREQRFSNPALETYYQNTLTTFQAMDINMAGKLHQ